MVGCKSSPPPFAFRYRGRCPLAAPQWLLVRAFWLDIQRKERQSRSVEGTRSCSFSGTEVAAPLREGAGCCTCAGGVLSRWMVWACGRLPLEHGPSLPRDLLHQ